MKIILYGSSEDTEKIYDMFISGLEELGLGEFINLEKSNDLNLKEKLNFKLEPVIIIEEETIDFIDVILEGIVPSYEEIKSIIISIIGGKGSECDSSMCGSGCFC